MRLGQPRDLGHSVMKTSKCNYTDATGLQGCGCEDCKQKIRVYNRIATEHGLEYNQTKLVRCAADPRNYFHPADNGCSLCEEEADKRPEKRIPLFFELNGVLYVHGWLSESQADFYVERSAPKVLRETIEACLERINRERLKKYGGFAFSG